MERETSKKNKGVDPSVLRSEADALVWAERIRGGHGEISLELIEELATNDVDRFMDLCGALGSLKEVAAVPELMRAMRSTRLADAHASCVGLAVGAIGCRKVTRELLEILRLTPTRIEAVVFALQNLQDARAIESLWKVAKNSGLNTSLRHVAIVSLLNLRYHARARRYLRRIVNDNEVEFAANAVRALSCVPPHIYRMEGAFQGVAAEKLKSVVAYDDRLCGVLNEFGYLL